MCACSSAARSLLRWQWDFFRSLHPFWWVHKDSRIGRCINIVEGSFLSNHLQPKSKSRINRRCSTALETGLISDLWNQQATAGGGHLKHKSVLSARCVKQNKWELQSHVFVFADSFKAALLVLLAVCCAICHVIVRQSHIWCWVIYLLSCCEAALVAPTSRLHIFIWPVFTLGLILYYSLPLHF